MKTITGFILILLNRFALGSTTCEYAYVSTYSYSGFSISCNVTDGGILTSIKEVVNPSREKAWYSLGDVSLLKLYGTYKKIGAYAFRDLPELDNIVLAADELDKDAFSGLPKLRKIQIYGSPNMSTIPRNIFNSIKSLEIVNITGTSIKKIPGRLFGGMKNLIAVNLTNNKLEVIEKGAFSGSQNIKELILDENSLSALSITMFDGLLSLDTISLKSNNISVIHEKQFEKVVKLSKLRLDNNNIQFLPRNLFRNNGQLVELTLGNNLLQNVPGNQSNYFSYLKNLKKLNLRQNRFRTLTLMEMSDLETLDLAGNCFLEEPTIPDGVRFLNLSYCCLKQLRSNYYSLRTINIDLEGNDFSKQNGLFSYDYANYNNVEINLSKCKLSFVTMPIVYDNAIINLSFNNITSLKNVSFSASYRISMSVMNLKGNQISSLKNGSVGWDSQTLDLSNNIISYVNDTFFDDFLKLETIDLSNNHVQTLSSKLFMRNTKLKYVSLKNNRLKKIEKDFLTNTNKVLGIDLSDNQFYCDCDMALYINTIVLHNNNITGTCRDNNKGEQSLISLKTNLEEFSKNISCNFCPINPCNYHGDCFPDNITGFRCQCDEGYKGDLCQVDIVDCHRTQSCGLCKKNTCGENKQCIEINSNQTECSCTYGFQGVNCDEPSCVSNQSCGICQIFSCENSGICVEYYNGTNLNSNCTCLPGYIGSKCELSEHCQTSDDCNQRGLCKVTTKGRICDCFQGYSGDHCEKSCLETDEDGYCRSTCIETNTCGVCKSDTCKNAGKCNEVYDSVKKEYTAECVCPDSFKGQYCEIEDNSPCYDDADCYYRGRCVQQSKGRVCNCNIGFSGDFCQYNCVDDQSCGICNNTICKNHGVCREVYTHHSKNAYLAADYECVCKYGYAGEHCELDFFNKKEKVVDNDPLVDRFEVHSKNENWNNVTIFDVFMFIFYAVVTSILFYAFYAIHLKMKKLTKLTTYSAEMSISKDI